MKPLRVLHFGRFGNHLGGVERHAHHLCQQLASMGIDVTNLVASSDKHASETHCFKLYHQIQVPCWGVAFSTALAPTLPIKAWQLHRDHSFDLLHLHFPDPLTHLASRMLPPNIPRVISWHSDIVRQKKILRYYHPFLLNEIRRADALIAATHAHFSSSHQIPDDYPVEKRHVVPYGMSYTKFERRIEHEPMISKLHSIAQGRPIVFALGRHVYYKGFNVLIDAIQKTNAYLILGGDGPLRQQLEQTAASLALQERILFTGRIEDADLPAYFHACDVFCLPSVEQSEAFGLVQLEAMSCGKPVICTQLNNGVNEVNQHLVTGLAVPPNDHNALADAINRLLTDLPLRTRLSRQAHEHALSSYSLNEMGKRCLAVYESVLRNKIS